ncbi:MAG: hypothetical protein WCJ09_17515 [Planctomycetota bacterium]
MVFHSLKMPGLKSALGINQGIVQLTHQYGMPSGTSMGTYNTTAASITCLRCRREETFVVDLYFGNTAMMVTVPLGTLYPFCIGKPPENGGPPASDRSVGMGYTECPHCSKDFFCSAVIHHGILVSIEPDRTQLPLIPDSESPGRTNCPECRSPVTQQQYFHGFDHSKLICQACGVVRSIRIEGNT